MALYYAASCYGRPLDYHATSHILSPESRGINAHDTPHGTAPADGIVLWTGILSLSTDVNGTEEDCVRRLLISASRCSPSDLYLRVDI
jgi:hypothetical protein